MCSQLGKSSWSKRLFLAEARWMSGDLSCFIEREVRVADGNYTNSTLFVDFLGALPGTNSSSFNSTAARNASQAIAAEISTTVKAGYMVRASADWDVSRPTLDPVSRPLSQSILHNCINLFCTIALLIRGLIVQVFHLDGAFFSVTCTGACCDSLHREDLVTSLSSLLTHLCCRLWNHEAITHCVPQTSSKQELTLSRRPSLQPPHCSHPPIR